MSPPKVARHGRARLLLDVREIHELASASCRERGLPDVRARRAHRQSGLAVSRRSILTAGRRRGSCLPRRKRERLRPRFAENDPAIEGRASVRLNAVEAASRTASTRNWCWAVLPTGG